MIFFVWFGACFFCILFVWLMIYETKGLSLEQVDQLYIKVSDARQPASLFGEEVKCGWYLSPF